MTESSSWPTGSSLVDDERRYDLMLMAKAIAKVAHNGQKRKGNGEPYFMHLARVASRVESLREKTIAYLHDTVEDTYIGPAALSFVGFPLDVVNDVLALSRRGGETYAQFILRTIETGSDDALRVKLADLQDNLDDLSFAPGLDTRYKRAERQIRRELREREAERASLV